MEFVRYGNDGRGIATITLNRPPANAFNRNMGSELIEALESFASLKNELILILTGEGKFFSTGEDLANINLYADMFHPSQYADAEMRCISKYAKDALGQYHKIVKAILTIDKPIVALLNGAAAGAGMSIALACDRRFVAPPQYFSQKPDMESVIFIPAFGDMGLIPDSGMTVTLPRLVGWRVAQKMFETPRERVTLHTALQLGLVEKLTPASTSESPNNAIEKMFENVSFLSYGHLKKMRNDALVDDLKKLVFPWELAAQTECLRSHYFKKRVAIFLANQKTRKEEN